MNFDIPVLVDLSLKGFASLLFLLALVDTVFAMLLALKRGEFSGAYASNFLLTHVVQAWFPIMALAIVGHGLPAFDLPPIGAFTTAAELGLTAYAITTGASLSSSLRSTSPGA